MNENEFDLTARAWLDDGPTRMSDLALQSALEEIHTTRQRRVRWPAWRATGVNTFARVAIVATLGVAISLVAINAIPRQPDGSAVGGPSPSTAPDQTEDFPALTTTFVSPRNGFSVKYFDRGEGTVTPAEQMWGFDGSFDVVETGLAAVFEGASTEFSRGELCFNSEDEPISCGSIDIQIDDAVSNVFPGGCGVPRSQQAEITIDGRSGRIAECPNHIEATVRFGGRLYLFTLSHGRDDARAVFDAFIATVDLTPWTAVDFPVLTETFVSPTYGYSFGSVDRGGITPASERWDPGNQPVEDNDFDPRFDAVETGLGAYLEGASTPIPDGVSIDAWVDEHVTPVAAGGCGVLRSRQEEITIDGQSGRIAECDHTEATVVAGGRLYLFILYRPGIDRRAMFDSWSRTINLTPETAAP